MISPSTIVLYLAVVLLFAVPDASVAQPTVYLEAKADDHVGRRLVYLLRENLRQSRGMKFVHTDDDSFCQIRLVTLDPDKNGTQTIYSAVITVSQFTKPSVKIYWTNLVGVCGSDVIRSCAEDLTANLDQVVTDVRAILTEGLVPKE